MADIVKAVTPLLAELDFKKRAGGVFTADISYVQLGWLGLNRATQHRPAGEVEINPVVGVRHQGVERMVAELRGERFQAHQPPTVSTPLGYLLPERRYRGWVFGISQPVDIVAQEMVGAIAEHGVTFMRGAAALPDLCRYLEKGIGFGHQVAYRRPVAWLLAGDRRRAGEVLDEAFAKLGGRKDLAAEELRRFAAALQSRLAEAR